MPLRPPSTLPLRAPHWQIIECVGGGEHWHRATSSRVLKAWWLGGRFCAVCGDDAAPLVQSAVQLASFAAGMLWRPLWTTAAPWVPAYRFGVAVATATSIAAVLAHVAEKRLRIPLDAAGSFPFTAAGVIAALRLQAGGHAHGKVVVTIDEATETAAAAPTQLAT